MQGSTENNTKSLLLGLLLTKTALSAIALICFLAVLAYFGYAASLGNPELMISSIILAYTIFYYLPSQKSESIEIKDGLIGVSINVLISTAFVIAGYLLADFRGMITGQMFALLIIAVIRGEVPVF